MEECYLIKRIINIFIGIIFILSLCVFMFFLHTWEEGKREVYDEAYKKGAEHGFDVGYSLVTELVASGKIYEDKHDSEIEVVFRKDHETVYQDYLKQETFLFDNNFITDWGKEKAKKYYREGYEEGYKDGYLDGYDEEYDKAYSSGFFAGERAYKIENGKYLTEKEREKENSEEDYKKEYQEAYEKGYKEGYAEAEDEAIQADLEYNREKYNEDDITEEDIQHCLEDGGTSAMCVD